MIFQIFKTFTVMHMHISYTETLVDIFQNLPMKKFMSYDTSKSMPAEIFE